MLLLQEEASLRHDREVLVKEQLASDPVALYLHLDATSGDAAAAAQLAMTRALRCVSEAASAAVLVEPLPGAAAASRALQGASLSTVAQQLGASDALWVPMGPPPPPPAPVAVEADPKAAKGKAAPAKKPAAKPAAAKGGKGVAAPTAPVIPSDPVLQREPPALCAALPLDALTYLRDVCAMCCSIIQWRLHSCAHRCYGVWDV